MSEDTSIGRGKSEFPSTVWDVLTRIAAKQASEQDVASLAERYWRPVYRFIRSAWKKPVEEAKDLTQEFFATVFDVDFLRQADPDRGNFRQFVLTSLRNFLRNTHRSGQAQKRGGGRLLFSLDSRPVEDLKELAMSEANPEEAFNEAWAGEILRRAVEHLEIEYGRAGKSDWFEAFRKHYLLEGNETGSYRSIARELGTQPSDVHNYLAAARRDLRRLCAQILRETVGDPQLEEEMALLFGRLP